MIPDSYLEELHASLAARAEQVCAHLLPGGKRVQKRWQCGGVDGGPGKSMDVEIEGEKAGVFHDRATGETGRLLKLWQLNRGLDFKDAVAAAADFVGMGPPDEEGGRIDPSQFQFNGASSDEPPAYKTTTVAVVDWDRCVNEFTEEKAAELCEWRGYTPEFVTHLRNEKLIGCHNGHFAFPVTNSAGKIVAVHFKGPEGWRYFPQGAESSLFVLGSPNHATFTLAFESQWDAFAVLDKLNAHLPENAGVYAALVTRSATSNTDISKFATPNLIALPQNDPREKNGKPNVNKEGRTPSEEWLFRIQASRNKISQFSVFELSERHKDHNDWIRAENPDHFDIFNKVIEGARNPILKSTRSVATLLDHNVKDDPNALIGQQRRFLSKGGSWMIIGPSGVGKSTLITSLCLNAAAGATWHGLTFRRPLKTLVVQAENDDGDLAEMLLGACATVRNEFTKAQFIEMGKNLMFEQVTDKIGEKFTRWLEEIIREAGIDLVVIDPLLSFVGDDISQQKVASQFFRNYLQPVLKRTGAICVLVHHTGKPSKDKDSQKGWNDSDFSYIGLGSSEIVNWPRAVSVLVHTSENGVFLLKNCKRGGRAGMVSQFTGHISTDIYLRHGVGSEGSQWLQTKKPEESEPEEKFKGGKRKAVDMETLIPHVPATATYKALYDIICTTGGLSAYAAKQMISEMLLARAIVKKDDGLYHKNGGRE
jgi:hypothetical protein